MTQLCFAAKFLKREDLNQHTTFASDASGSAGPIGTHYYNAPELVPKEQRCMDIDEKADMYSLGVILFELWHPFTTRMERHCVLEDLMKYGVPPADWAAKFPEQVF